MDNENLEKFNLSFYLAVLFHLFVMALVILAVSLENQKQTAKPFQMMGAAIIEEKPALAAADIPQQQLAKSLSKAEKRRLARAQKLLHRLEQQERKRFLAAAAQRMVLSAIEEKRLAQQTALEKARQEQKNLPVLPANAAQANAFAAPALDNAIEKKNISKSVIVEAKEQDV